MNKAAIDIVELRNCPFCGKAPLRNSHVAWCGGAAEMNHEKVIQPLELWNTRTPDPIIMEMVEALEEARIVLRENGFGEHAAVIVQIDATLTKVRGK